MNIILFSENCYQVQILERTSCVYAYYKNINNTTFGRVNCKKKPLCINNKSQLII